MTNPGSLNTCVRVVERGLFAGALATGPMSGVMLAGKALGLLGTPPPKEITAKAAIATVTASRDASAMGRIVHFPGAAPSRSFRAVWVGGHVLYGAGCGGVFAGLQRWLPGVPARAIASLLRCSNQRGLSRDRSHPGLRGSVW